MKIIQFIFVNALILSGLISTGQIYCALESPTGKLSAVIAHATKLPRDAQNLIIDYAAGYWDKKNITNMYVVIVPVADATTSPAHSFDPSKSAEQMHQEMPHSPETGPNSCVRVHQLLFNECVKVIQELDDEVECEISTAFYSDPKKDPVNKFWTLKKYLRPLQLFSMLLYAVPAPYADLKTQKLIPENCITLIKPWNDTARAIVYSAGTRFIHNQTLDTSTTFGAYAIDPKTNSVAHLSIAKDHALSQQHATAFDTKIKLFLGLLTDWTKQQPSKIPYVWGGCSYMITCEPKEFSLVNTDRNNIPISYWTRPIKTSPQTGFDCSGLVLRAAQICGLAYFYKNTTTLTHYLKQLESTEKIIKGDLLWISGHVMVVSNLEPAEVIHASGYAHGFASVQTNRLSELFKDVHNFNELQKLSQKQISLKYLDSHGKCIKEIPAFAIYRITR